MTPLRVGLLRLVDSAPVVVAEARGLFAAAGLDARISIEPSWANIADKLAWGLLDGAVMLPPLALALASGLRGKRTDLVVPMGLSLGGNAVVAAKSSPMGLPPMGSLPNGMQPLAAGRALLAWLRQQPVRRMAVVHDYSTHSLLLRYWLAASGGELERDPPIVVVPPERMVAALAQGQIAGFCAGAPWCDEAALRGAGQVLLGTSAIWPRHPEKCLVLAGGWIAANAHAMPGVLRAVLAAQAICDEPAEAEAIVALLAERLTLPRTATRAALPGGAGVEQIRFADAARVSPHHAVWFLGQMRRWGWLPPDLDIRSLAGAVYRPAWLAQAAPALAALPPAPDAVLCDGTKLISI